MKQEELLKLVEHIEIPIDIVKQSEMLKNEYLPALILRTSDVRPRIALSLIKEFDLEKNYDVKEIVGNLINKNKFEEFEFWIKEFGLDEDKDWLKKLIKRIILKKGFDTALSLIEKYGLEDEFNVKELIENCFYYLEKYDYDVSSIIEWIRKFGLDKDIDWLKEQVQKMINENKYNVVYYLIKRFDLYKDKEWFKEQIQKIANEKGFELALSLINFLDLKKEFNVEVKEIIGELINQNEFNEAYYYIKIFGLNEDKEWLKEQVQKVVNKKGFDLALEWIKKFKLEEEFDVKKLIEDSLDDEYAEHYVNFVEYWIKEFGLKKNKKWLKRLVQKIYDMGETEIAYKLVNYFNLEKEFKI